MEIGVHKTTDTSLSWVSYGAMSVPCLTRVIPGT